MHLLREAQPACLRLEALDSTSALRVGVILNNRGTYEKCKNANKEWHTVEQEKHTRLQCELKREGRASPAASQLEIACWAT